MLELLFTSFPVIIKYFILRARKEPMTVGNMYRPVFLWLVMASALFVIIFYFHPKSVTGVVPFRTVSVVAQTGGPVTAVFVQNGQRVEEGDLLFAIESSSQQAALAEALAVFDSLAASGVQAQNAVRVAETTVEQAQITLRQLNEDLADNEQLLQRGVARENTVIQLRSDVQVARSVLEASEAQLNLAQAELTHVLPAARSAAQSAFLSAETEFAKTEVRAFAAGRVTQLALSVGSPASRLVLSPSLIIIPDRDEEVPVRVVAGFSQVASGVIHEGMPAEIVCDSNVNITMRNAVMPARIVEIQSAIAAGQVTPSGNLIDLDSRARRGSVVVFFELVYPEHAAMLLDGSGCMVQTYTNNLDGTIGHIIGATGIIKAFLLRIKVWGTLITGVGIGGGGYQ